MEKFDPLKIAADILGINDNDKLLEKEIKSIMQLSDKISIKNT